MSRQHLACKCGSFWFALHPAQTGENEVTLAGVAFELDGRVSAYSGVPVCVECGEAMVGGREVMEIERVPQLRLVE